MVLGKFIATKPGSSSAFVQPSVDEFLGLDNHDLAGNVIKQLKPENETENLFLKEEPAAKVDLLDINEELTTRIIVRSRNEKATVHGALQAASS